jgi:hypothetical protein
VEEAEDMALSWSTKRDGDHLTNKAVWYACVGCGATCVISDGVIPVWSRYQAARE